MSDFKNNPGQGQLFENGYKTKDSQPDYKGKICDPSGKEWDISGWWKEGQNGRFMSIAIQEPWVKPEDKRPEPKPIGGKPGGKPPLQPGPEDFDDDIPF
jgi:hypothetical protein